MNYRQLGKSALNISEIGFGCMSLGDKEAEATDLIHRAFDSGINFFDTADIYAGGQNEVLVGKALYGMRHKVILASKAGNVIRRDGSGLDWNPSKAHILSSIEASLRRLQTDYLDLYQLHGGTINDNIDETIEAFELLKEQGKIRQYGISSIRPNVIRRFADRSSIVSVMMQYSLLDRRPEETCLDVLQEANIGVLARGSVAQGLLAGKEARAYLGYSPAEVRATALAVESFSSEQRRPAATAIRYTLQHPAVASAIVGIRTTEQLNAAIAASASPALTPTELQLLQSSVTPKIYQDHR